LKVLVLIVLLPGCASIDYDYPRIESHVLTDTDDTYFGRRSGEALRDKPANEAGFYALSDGIEALAARVLLVDRAEKSIDVQYYLIKPDLIGRGFVLALLNAADRGVRVRLLLDDVFTKGYDVGLLALDAHPNFEIRIFNPFSRGFSGRRLGAIPQFSRVNRRMHNKSFTIDNQVTIIGGRNIAEEYFGASEKIKFGDLDVIGVGPIVQEVSTMFDSYWNHETAIPVRGFIRKKIDPDAELERRRQTFENALEELRESEYGGAVREQAYAFLHSDASIFSWSPYSLVYDSPDKGVKKKAKSAASIVTPLSESIRGAEHEILIISPYFIPLKQGEKALADLKDRGVDITVITNSLAANNHTIVHSGYSPSRKPLLRNGIKLYEARDDAAVRGAELVSSVESRSTLHTKAYIVDREDLFIGSFNFDPRSANLNTEMGVIIHDPRLAAAAADRLKDFLPEKAWEVFLDEKGRLRWRGIENGAEVIYKKEPRTSWWKRFKAGFMGLLPIKSQL